MCVCGKVLRFSLGRVCRSSLETPTYFKGHFGRKGCPFQDFFFPKDRPIFHNCRDKNGPGKILGIFFIRNWDPAISKDFL